MGNTVTSYEKKDGLYELSVENSSGEERKESGLYGFPINPDINGHCTVFSPYISNTKSNPKYDKSKPTMVFSKENKTLDDLNNEEKRTDYCRYISPTESYTSSQCKKCPTPTVCPTPIVCPTFAPTVCTAPFMSKNTIIATVAALVLCIILLLVFFFFIKS
jgi:hypothetical protein